MGRYLIIDTSKLNAEFLVHTIQQGVKDRVILSEEETMAKFKQVFNAGVDFGSYLYAEYWGELGKEVPSPFYEYSKEL